MTEQEKPGSKAAGEDDARAGNDPPEDEQRREDSDEAGEDTGSSAGTAGAAAAAGVTAAEAISGDESTDSGRTSDASAEDNGDDSADQSRDTTAPGPSAGGGSGKLTATVAWLALIAALAAAGLGGYRWWQDRSTGTGLASAVDGLQTEVADNADTVADLENRLSSLQQNLQQELQQAQQSLRQAADADELDRLQRQFRQSRDVIESLPGRMENLEESMANLQGISAGARDAWLTAEAEYYMQLANAQVQLAGNAELAAFALELADRRIRELGDPVYTPVRRELADEITALRAVEDVDTEGVTLTLASLADVVQSLPLDEEVTPEDEPRPEIDGELSGLSRAWTAVKNAFSDMVSVRRTDEQLEPLLSPEAQYFLRTNIALQLQTARLALLQGEDAIFRQSLRDAGAWLERYFDTDSKAVSGAMETIAELADSPVSAELPDVSASLRLFRQQQAVAEGGGQGSDRGADEGGE